MAQQLVRLNFNAIRLDAMIIRVYTRHWRSCRINSTPFSPWNRCRIFHIADHKEPGGNLSQVHNMQVYYRFYWSHFPYYVGTNSPATCGSLNINFNLTSMVFKGTQCNMFFLLVNKTAFHDLAISRLRSQYKGNIRACDSANMNQIIHVSLPGMKAAWI